MVRYTAKSDDFKDGEWIPKTWQRKEQVALIDHIMMVYRQWLQDMRGLAEELKQAKSTSYTDYGHEGPYGDTYAVQNPRGATVYEGAEPDMYDLSPVEDSDLYLDMMGVSYDSPILDSCPEPSSAVLERLDAEFQNVFDWMWAAEDADLNWHSIISNWENSDGDPAWNANNAGVEIAYYADTVEQKATPFLNDLRGRWVEELERLAEQAHEDYVQDTLDGGAYLSLKFVEDAVMLADEALESIEQSTSTRAEDEIKFYTKAFEEMTAQAADVPGMMAEDVAFMSGAVGDLREITGRSHHSDIRAWEARGVQQEDAKIAVDRIRSYWVKRLQQMDNIEHIKKVNRLAQKKAAGTVPNYRFKVGEIVKAKNRYGKVIGARLEGGTGKQVYEVKVNGVDKPKLYYNDELQRAE